MVEQQDDVHRANVGESGDPVAPRRAPGGRRARRPHPTRTPQRRQLSQYRVLLHNDGLNEMGFVVRTLIRLTPLNRMRATLVMLHAHYHGVALVLITHRERAELYQSQFRRRGLTVTIERDA